MSLPEAWGEPPKEKRKKKKSPKRLKLMLRHHVPLLTDQCIVGVDCERNGNGQLDGKAVTSLSTFTCSVLNTNG